MEHGSLSIEDRSLFNATWVSSLIDNKPFGYMTGLLLMEHRFLSIEDRSLLMENGSLD